MRARPRPNGALQSWLLLAPVIPVLSIHDESQAVELARALVRGGLPLLEVTLRTPAALPAIRAIADAVPQAIVGAGTVLDRRGLAAARAAGARFAVSPGTTSALVRAAHAMGMPLLPGVMTPSEILAALEAGFTALKFFPAQQAGGAAFLRALSGPFPQLRFCPTGGIDRMTAQDYLRLPNVCCVGGSWVAPQALVEAGDWDGVEGLARQAASLDG